MIISAQIKRIIDFIFAGIFLQLFLFSFVYPNGPIRKISGTTIKILPLGNSITYDNRSNDTRNIGEKAGYRGPLYSLLKNAGYKFDFIGSEHSGGNYLPAGYDENGGFPGISDDELLYLMQTGHLLQLNQGIDRQVTAGPYLETYSPDVILLHIGTNNNDQPDGTSSNEVEQILDEIDNFESSSGKEVIVLLARIINRAPNQSFVNQFNDNITTMALDRVQNPNNDAYPDNIIIVDMQDSAKFNYVISPDPNGSPGDMNDTLHPNNNGYAKMANQWFKALKNALPNPPEITSSPQDYYTVEGGSAKFTIDVSSNEQVFYQWRKNGSNISFATNSVLELNNVSLSDNNSDISCIVTNINGSVISNAAKLFIGNKYERIKSGILAEYDFEEGEGNVIFNKIVSNNNLDLNINSAGSVQWISKGISIQEASDISTVTPVNLINDSINYSNQFSVELWISPSATSQSEPARIITISANNNERNFTLDQNNTDLILRTRTTETNLNGLPEFNSQSGINPDNLTHIVVTRGIDGFENVYVNGSKVQTALIEGKLSNWDSNYKLAIGNEFSTSIPWLGNIYYLSIYKRELSPEEIQHNFSLGEGGITDIINTFPISNSFELYQNYPNPFNPSTTIKYHVPNVKTLHATPQHVQLKVFDVLGKKVAILVNEIKQPGNYEITFDASHLTSGVYYYQLNAGSFMETKKMILLR